MAREPVPRLLDLDVEWRRARRVGADFSVSLVLDSSDVAFEAHAVAFFRKLRARVLESMRRDAETDAEAEIAREDRANAEMVGWYARGAA